MRLHKQVNRKPVIAGFSLIMTVTIARSALQIGSVGLHMNERPLSGGDRHRRNVRWWVEIAGGYPFMRGRGWRLSP